jgi:apolipoprotein N-acyltransferase
MKTLKSHLSNPYLAFVLGNLFMILGSAKWTVFVGPWLGLPLILYFMRRVRLWKAIVFGFLGLFVSGFIGVYEVFPAPLPVLIIILLIITAKSLVPYLVDRLSGTQAKGFLGTLVFPAAFVAMEYLNVMENGDVWGSIANTQYQFLAIQQIASVFGIWGVSFLIAWFASLANWMSEHKWSWARIKTGGIMAGAIYFLVVTFGIIRISQAGYSEAEKVMIGGVTLDNSNIIESMYHDEFGKTITISPELSQTSPELQEANRAMVPFIEDPFAGKFKNVRREINANLDLLFDKTRQLADQGAKIVVWSEAIGLTLNTWEDSVVERARKMAEDKQIYLFISLGVINPGPFDPERLLLVNKTVTLTPEGEIANVYLKSNPIPFAEQEYGSDDIIPVIESPYGRLSPVICYDADFPEFLKQTDQIGTDILMVPSGDWKAIDPYHAYMSRLRGIENGISVVRPVSRATSIATDPYGRSLGSSDFYTSEEKSFMAGVPMKGVNTLYNQIGDLLPYLALVLTAFILLEILLKPFRKRRITMNSQNATPVEV